MALRSPPQTAISVSQWRADQLHQIASRPGVKAVISVEMSQGQMVDDVKLAVNGAAPVHFFGRAGGSIPTVDEVADFAASVVKGGAGK